MKKFPCVIMRAGTSKGVFFKQEDMPKDKDKWSDFLLDVMGSPDMRQIDGLGGANSLTSKVAIIGKSEKPGVDVDYTFAQVSLTQSVVDMKGNCGNISSGVGPFAVDEEIVPTDIEAGVKEVVIINTNTDKIITSEVKIRNGKFDSVGNLEIPGVPGCGSDIGLSFYGSEGAVTGKVLPTGKTKESIVTSRGMIEISIVDAANPLVYMKAEDVGLKGSELPSEMTAEHLNYIEEVRSIAAELCGFASRENATLESPAVPKATIVSSAQTYRDMKGREYDAGKMDLSVRMMSMQKPHQALAITGAVCISVAAGIEGTIVQELVGQVGDEIRMAHPGGVMTTNIKMDGTAVKCVRVSRTARRIMEGYVFTNNEY